MNEERSKARGRRRVVRKAKRLAIREYVPLACWVVGWIALGIAIGHADAVRLLAAHAFVQAVRHVCTMEVLHGLGQRSGTSREVYNAARGAALRIELGSLLACAAVTAALVALLGYRGLGEAAAMVAIAAAAIPARTPGALLVAGRKRHPLWRVGAAVMFVAGSAIVVVLGLHWVVAAAVLALREWGGLVTTLLFAPPNESSGPPRQEPLTFAEAAQRTESSARRRLSYRLISSVASLTLGPFGNVAARTSREVGKLDSRLARLVPRSKSGFALFTLGTAAAAAFFLVVSREPSTLLAAAAFARLSAAGAAVLIWWRYAASADTEDDVDED